MADIKKDKRFTSVLTDPIFRNVPKGERKTKIDKRFKAMFKDKDFKLKYVMDKRGRPLNTTSSEDLKRFYHLSSESDDDGSDTSSESNSENDNQVVDEEKIPEKSNQMNISKKKSNLLPVVKPEKTNKVEVIDNQEQDSSESADNSPSEEESLSEDSDDDDDDEDLLVGEFDHKWGELTDNAPVASEITKRIAVCNMDWDRIRAEDLLAVFNSFKPVNAVIYSVKIYPSEYGLKRMEDEKINGPAELVEQKLGSDEEEDKDPNKEGSKYHREKLRQYQLNRLKYYFAVVECDSPETADSLYEQLNGMEYESSAVCMDIRFIPDDVTFDEEPTSTVTSAPNPAEYKPRLFANSALQQVKVNLTWDETDPRRRDTLLKAFREPESIEKDIRNYLASSSSDSDCDPVDDSDDLDEKGNHKLKMEDRIQNYRSLLQSLEEKEKDDEEKYEMEVIWEPGLKEKTEELVKEKITKNTLTPFEEKLKKRKKDQKLKKKEKMANKNADRALANEEEQFSESSDDDNSFFDLEDRSVKSKKNKPSKKVESKRSEELSLMMSEPGQASENWQINLHKKKKKEKDEKTDNFEVNVNDDRFSAVYSSHLFHIDPSDPHYKSTKGMQKLFEAKQKKRKTIDRSSDSEQETKTDFRKKDENKVKSFESKRKLKHKRK